MRSDVFYAVFVMCMLLSPGIITKACAFNSQCDWNYYRIECGPRHGVPAYTHEYSSNGTIYVCGVTNERANHMVTCTKCGYYDIEVVERTCNILHSVCGSSMYCVCR